MSFSVRSRRTASMTPSYWGRKAWIQFFRLRSPARRMESSIGGVPVFRSARGTPFFSSAKRVAWISSWFWNGAGAFAVLRVDDGTGRPSRPRRSLRLPILLLIFLAIGPLLAGRLWQVTREADHSVAAAREQVSALADLATTQHHELISKTRTLLNILVRVPAVRDGLVDQCHILLRDLARGAAWQRRIWVVGTDGRARCGSHSPRADLDIADRDYFQRALQTKQFVVGDYMTTRVRNQPAIIAALPALDDYGDVEMVALVTLNVEAAEHPMKALDQGSHAILMVDSANVTISWRGAGEHSRARWSFSSCPPRSCFLGRTSRT